MRSILLGLVVFLATAESAQMTRASPQPTDLAHFILRIEDARSDRIEPLIEALRGKDPVLQHLAIRAIGRLQRVDLLRYATSLLSAGQPQVRAQAAHTMGQLALAGASVVEIDSVLRQRVTGVASTLETDPSVAGVIYETLGRLPRKVPDDVRQVETLLAEALGSAKESIARRGIVKGLEALIRLQAKQSYKPATTTLEVLRRIAATSSTSMKRDGLEPGFPVLTRRLAGAALIAARDSDRQTITMLLTDEDPQVRRLAVMMLDPSAISDTKNLLSAALQDRSYLVRFEALRAYGRHFEADRCEPSMRLLNDPHPHVALLAVDLLDRCPGQVDVLNELVTTLRKGSTERPLPLVKTGSWHAGAHAIVSMARSSATQASEWFEELSRHPTWQVRMYLARAAAAARVRAVLDRLAGDENDNVANASIEGLRELAGHEADSQYMAALARTDYQLVRTAARALAGSPKRAEAAAAVMAALARITTERSDTSRDTRLALLERLAELGGADLAIRLQRLLSDFDPRVAVAAAATLTQLTGNRYHAPVQPIETLALPEPAAIRSLVGATARITMAGGSTFTLKLRVDETPATCARFAALARRGYYDGLTFHRVAPNFVIQGGSPNANEYAGDNRYMRDEVGMLSHTRGTVGVSTRGRDTGDAQIFINLVDNPRLDHQYTVFAEVVEGLDVIDTIVEGDVMRRVEIIRNPQSLVPKPSRPRAPL